MHVYVLPLDPQDCPEQWGADDLDRALPPGLRADVYFYPSNENDQPRWESDEDNAESVANAVARYLGAAYRDPEKDLDAEPY